MLIRKEWMRWEANEFNTSPIDGGYGYGIYEFEVNKKTSNVILFDFDRNRK